MKKTIKAGIATLALLLGVTIGTKAQTKETKGSDRPALLLSAGPEAGIPLGNFGDFYKWSLGGSVQGDLAIFQKTLYVNLNAGFTNVFADDLPGVDDVQWIPVKAGLKYYPFKSNNLYVQGQAGVNFITSGPSGYKTAAFTYSPQIGYLIPLGKGNFLDAGVKFDGNTKFIDGGEAANVIGIRVAYAFGL
ncbi:hypothetical protein [Chitinophaga tropicalis]|uniref:Outer membrane protein beta-barrel domain-containing protein n=1 Tax=Chitinophaga tropicalis TaxID=2683588 RepID=A0A7K1U8A2_9BACT|nr:hypothetical protein [Chitinophaga tropicalis]MVT10591.1 hypothetical protein [Chitinophaga tropicalis]